METPRGLFLDQDAAGADAILLAIARRIAAMVPHSAGAKELDLVVAGLNADRDFPALEAGLRGGFARVCVALGVEPNDSAWSTNGTLEAAADAFFWCVLRWTFEGDVLDAETAIEWAEEMIATQTSPEAAREELCSLIVTLGGRA